MIRVKAPQDIGAGLLFILLGLAGVYFGRDLTYGSPMRMGPGFFPTWLSWIIVGMGIFIGARGFSIEGPPIVMPQLRPLLLVVAAILTFGAMIGNFGLPITVLVITFIAAFARPNPSLKETALLAIGLAIFAVLAFIYGLGQPLPLWWEF